MDEEPVRGEDEGRDTRVIGRGAGVREEAGRTTAIGIGDPFAISRGGERDTRAGLDAEDERDRCAGGEVGRDGDDRLQPLPDGRAAGDLLGIVEPDVPLVAHQAPTVDRDPERGHVALGWPPDDRLAFAVAEHRRQRGGLGPVAARVVVATGEQRSEAEANDGA